MTSIPDQFSDARSRQFETQLDFMRALTTQAFASAQQVLALNINTTRTSVEHSANTIKQLFSITDPRDLFTLGTQTQEQFQYLLDYGRELMSIATGASLSLSRQAGLTAPQVMTTPVAAAAVELHTAKAVQPGKQPVVAEPEPAVAATPARAEPEAVAAEPIADPATAVQSPSAAPVAAAKAEFPRVERKDAAAPQPSTEAKPAQRAPRANRKK